MSILQVEFQANTIWQVDTAQVEKYLKERVNRT